MPRQLGTLTHTQGNNYGRYEYIINQSQLAKAFNDSRNNVHYALLKESNRQRFLIANTRGLKEKFFESIKRDLANVTT